MRSSTRILLLTAGAVALMWGLAVLVMSGRERYECSVGASLDGCTTIDEILLFAIYGLPAVLVLIAVLGLLSWKPGRRTRR